MLPAPFNDQRLVLLGVWGRVAAVAALAVAVTIVVLALRGYRREPPGRRALLVTLRALAVACALVLFFQPARELRHLLSQPNHVAVLVDESQSMTVADQPGGPTRAERVAELLRANHDLIERWRADHRVDFYSFGDGLRPTSEEAIEAAASSSAPASGAPGAAGSVDRAAGSAFREPATDLREALADLRGRYDGSDLAGVVVVSDGIDNGRLAAEAGAGETRDFLAALGAPVHTVWAARPGLKDVAIERVLASSFAFVHTVVKIEAVVRVDGYGPVDLPITLSHDGQVLRTKVVHIDPSAPSGLSGSGAPGMPGDDDAGAAHVELEITPERVGKLVYELSVPVLPDEAVAGNNRRQIILKVLRDKVRVLQVAGRPSTDERFLRALLKRDPNVDLISFFILRTPFNVKLVSDDELSLIPFPTEELFGRQLPSFDLIVLQNFDYGPYQMAQYLGAIHDYVEGGGGLVMVGGDLAFAGGGYAGTPVADVLPVTLPKDGGAGGVDDPAWSPVPPAAGRPISTDDFRMQLTPAGESFPVTALRLDRAANDALWGRLPPLHGANLIAGARPGAVVLGTHPTLKGDDGQPMPVLAVADVGKGRTMALATDSSWAWGFEAAGSLGEEAGRAYQTFWENAIRWLIHDPDYDLVRVDTDASEYAPSAAVHVALRALDGSYRPARGQAVSVAVERMGAGGHPPPAPPAAPLVNRTVKTDEAGQAEIDLPPFVDRGGAGAYRVVARAEIAGRPAEGETVFLVRDEGKELAAVAGREDLLRLVSDATGGTYLGAETDLSQLAFRPPRVIAVDRKKYVELWSHPLVFFLAVGLLAAEWLLRRRHGYA